jgi:tetraacyldisaccharide 4'-kinase
LPAALQACWRLRRGVEVPTIDGLSVAFCGIARPDNFFQELRTAGVVLAATRRFRDHHYYADADLDRLLELRHRHNATAFVTTEKDAINLGDRLARLEPVHIATVRMQMEDAATAIDAMLATIAARNRKPA